MAGTPVRARRGIAQTDGQSADSTHQKGPLGRQLTDWIEGELALTQGHKTGDPFKLFAWQRRFARGAFKKGVKRAALSLARGPGKTTLVAGIAAAAIAPDGPLVQRRGEVDIVASSFEQGKIDFLDVLAFMEPWIEKDPARWRVQESANRAIIEDRKTGARVRAIGSDPRRAHGLRPALALLDEPAQWPTATSGRMFAALNTSLGKVPGSRLIALGTRPDDAGHWFAGLLDGGADFVLCYKADKDDDPLDPLTWNKACPQLARLPDLRAEFKAEAEQARRDPELMAQFKALRLNLGVADTVQSHLIGADVWAEIEGDADKDGPCVWGIDLGQTAAMCAITGYWQVTGRCESLAAFPADPPLEERERLDGVKPGLYRAMEKRGELLTLGGQVVPVDELLTAASERLDYPARIACDRWRLGELSDAMTKAAMLAPVIPRGQGFKDGGEDVRLFKTAVLSARVVPLPQLLVRSALSECKLVRDPAGNAKIAKAGEGKRRRGRDDPAVSTVLAVAEGNRYGAKRGGGGGLVHVSLDEL